MVEPEIAFINLAQLQVVIETFIKTIVKEVYEECKDEFNFFAKDKPFIIERINQIIDKPFMRVDYAKGIEILAEAVKNGVKFEDSDIFFGKDLGSEHERYLCEKVFNCPIFLQNFPMEIKAFYMKENDETKTYTGSDLRGVSGKTVAANDLLVPGVGEIVGGSQREDSYDKIMQRVKDLGMDISSIQ
jgi:asparaginyl-tRNA synthetase